MALFDYANRITSGASSKSTAKGVLRAGLNQFNIRGEDQIGGYSVDGKLQMAGEAVFQRAIRNL